MLRIDRDQWWPSKNISLLCVCVIWLQVWTEHFFFFFFFVFAECSWLLVKLCMAVVRCLVPFKLVPEVVGWVKLNLFMCGHLSTTGKSPCDLSHCPPSRCLEPHDLVTTETRLVICNINMPSVVISWHSVSKQSTDSVWSVGVSVGCFLSLLF